MNRQESRYFDTANKIDDALIEILEKKDFEYVTVKELCKAAGVNRSTFYLHYENTIDVLNECIERNNKRVQDEFGQTYEKIVPQDIKSEDAVFVQPKYLMPYLKYVRANQAFLRAVFQQNEIFKISKAMEKTSSKIFEPILKKFGYEQQDYRYVITFFINGMMAVITEWVKDGCKRSDEDICRIIINCVFSRGHDLFSRKDQDEIRKKAEALGTD